MREPQWLTDLIGACKSFDRKGPDRVRSVYVFRQPSVCAAPGCHNPVRRLRHVSTAIPLLCLDCLRPTDACAVCLTELPDGSRAKTCSDRCRKALSRNGNPGKPVKAVKLHCVVCGGALTGTRSHQETCSDRCRKAKSRRQLQSV